MGAMFKNFFAMFSFMFAAGAEAGESLQKVAKLGNNQASLALLEQDHEITIKRLELDEKVRKLRKEIAEQEAPEQKKLKSA